MSAFIPPQNLQAEKAVLGGILLDNKSLRDLPPEFQPECFYLPTHQQLFKAMLSLYESEQPIDVLTVSDCVKSIETVKIFELPEWGMPESIAHHANLVLEAWRQRRAIDAISEALRALQDAPHDHNEIIASLSSSLNDPQTGARAVSISDVMVETLKYIEKAQEASQQQLIPTGFTALDHRIGGVERGELVIIGGRPSMGKTSLAVDVAINAAGRGFKVLIVSVETTRVKLGVRMLARETKINGRRFRVPGGLNGHEGTVSNAASKLSQLAIHFIDREAGWANIKREIRRQKREGLDMVLLDYLTLLNFPAARIERRDVAVGRVAIEAKQLALSQNVAFLLLSQLSRKSEDRSDPEPTMSDLRESGEIEQAADIVIFPFRPVVYDPDYQPRDKAFLKVAKGRDLPIGKIPVRFNAEITSFSDWSEL